MDRETYLDSLKPGDPVNIGAVNDARPHYIMRVGDRVLVFWKTQAGGETPFLAPLASVKVPDPPKAEAGRVYYNAGLDRYAIGHLDGQLWWSHENRAGDLVPKKTPFDPVEWRKAQQA